MDGAGRNNVERGGRTERDNREGQCAGEIDGQLFVGRTMVLLELGKEVRSGASRVL